MKKPRSSSKSVVRSPARVSEDDMLPEYGFTGVRRNPYAARFAAGVTVVLLEPDVAAKFPDSAAVNDALRGLLDSGSKGRARRSRSRTG